MLSPVAIKNGVCPHSCCSSALLYLAILIYVVDTGVARWRGLPTTPRLLCVVVLVSRSYVTRLFKVGTHLKLIHVKKTGFSCVATGGPGQKPDRKKMPGSVRQPDSVWSLAG